MFKVIANHSLNAWVLCMAIATPLAAQTEIVEDPKDIIAVQIRKQGFACDNPESATQIKEQSKPDEPVWFLKCDGASYSVRMMPDQAAKVEKLD